MGEAGRNGEAGGGPSPASCLSSFTLTQTKLEDMTFTTEPKHEAAPYERVIFNDSVYRDERARQMLFGGARAQLAQQQLGSSQSSSTGNNKAQQPATSLLRAAQLPNQRRQTAIGIQATSSSSGSENDSASYSQSQLAAASHHRPHPPPPLALSSLQQTNTMGISATAAVEPAVVPTRPQQQDHRISAVLHAISNGRVSMLRSVWSSDLPLYVDEHKNTVLHWCAKYEGAAKCLKWLIKNTQVPLSSRNFRGELCTHVAARHGVLSCLKVALMSANGNSNSQVYSAESSGGGASNNASSGTAADRLFSATEKDKRGFTILHLAVIKQRFPIVRWLTKQAFSALLVRIADNNNNLPLHYAALRGSKKMAQVLLKKNKDMLNLRNISGATPLHVAAFEGRSVSFVQWLVEEVGADATAVMESGVNLLHVAAAGGSIMVVRYLLSTTRQPAEAVLSRSQDGSTIFHFSAANGHAQLLHWLWSQRGTASSRVGPAGFLPTSSTSSSANRSSSASPLSTALTAGIHLRNTLGNSPVHAAAEAGQAATFRLLVEFGADIFGKNKAGFSALELALANKNPGLVRLADDIRRLLLDPSFANSPESNAVPGHGHLTLPNRAPQTQQNPQAGKNPANRNRNLASTLAGYHSNLASTFQALHLPAHSDNRLQTQLHIATGELGTLDGGNIENDEEAVHRNGEEADNDELYVVRRVNDNVFLRQGEVQQNGQQQHHHSQHSHQQQHAQKKLRAQPGHVIAAWRDRIFPSQKERRNSHQNIINSAHLNSVPELATLMSQEMRNRLQAVGTSMSHPIYGGDVEEGAYWDRLSTDIRRLLAMRRYP